LHAQHHVQRTRLRALYAAERKALTACHWQNRSSPPVPVRRDAANPVNPAQLTTCNL
jgi:hypothetical protein